MIPCFTIKSIKMEDVEIGMSELDWKEVLVLASESGAYSFLDDPNEDVYENFIETQKQ